ncbi:hypothetical protein M2302_005127 [Micromonospora sp. A200]|uniref:hypothetical protein n=1 Tax=Micromonospora sp. A200 TaxID=2940568 RepID=UPI00247317FE|nr:hypothetical protein [Micromonospora sp. A200]MDH6464926.1 hypothetical protein [Micromonospora sp. A200]
MTIRSASLAPRLPGGEASLITWSGDDWEEWCLALMRQHYGADQVQEIPATDGGDLGIEAFTYSGTAFQCYAAQDCYSTNDLYEKQRDKLTVDLGKIRRKEAQLAQLLGPVLIDRYMFMVPKFESFRIVQHASTKTNEYRALGLSVLTDTFQIVVCTDDAFAAAKAAVAGRMRPLVDSPLAERASIEAWMQDNGELIGIVSEKLALKVPDPTERRRYVESLIIQYIDGQNGLDGMHLKYPEHWQDTLRCINDKERLLALEYPANESDSLSILTIAKDLQKEIEYDVPIIDTKMARRIAWGTIADWLMRCPLDPRPVAGRAL